MRIESLLDSMKFEDHKEKNLPIFRNPPILNGFESKLSLINIKDKKMKKENLSNSLIKRESDDKLFKNPLILKNEAKTNIRSPPNFLY